MTDYVKTYDTYIKSFLEEKDIIIKEQEKDIKDENDVYVTKGKIENKGIEEIKVVTQKIIDYHRLQISYLQHERLIHLIVTALVSLLLFASFCLLLWITSISTMALFCILFFVDGFYLMHYYFLENKVQSWYIIEKKLVDIYENKS